MLPEEPKNWPRLTSDVAFKTFFKQNSHLLPFLLSNFLPLDEGFGDRGSEDFGSLRPMRTDHHRKDLCVGHASQNHQKECRRGCNKKRWSMWKSKPPPARS